MIKKGKCSGNIHFPRPANVSHTPSALFFSSRILSHHLSLVEAAKVSSFSVCTNEWKPDDAGGSTNIYVCKDDNVPDVTQPVGTYSFVQGSLAATGSNDLVMVTEQFEINGCILQRTGTWDNSEDAPTEYGIWTTTGNTKGCPKPSNIADYEYPTVAGASTTEFEMYTFEFKRAVAKTPLTHSSKK